MTSTQTMIRSAIMLGLISLSTACVVAGGPREGYHEGYYDRDHNRYYHENGWRDCGEHDEHCR
jgi:hypothetical protein